MVRAFRHRHLQLDIKRASISWVSQIQLKLNRVGVPNSNRPLLRLWTSQNSVFWDCWPDQIHQLWLVHDGSFTRWWLDDGLIDISDFFPCYVILKLLLFIFMCWSFYFRNNFGTLLQTCVCACANIEATFICRGPLLHFRLQLILLYNSYFFLLIKFLKRSLHQMKLSEVGFCLKVEFFTPRLESKFFSGFFSHVEEQGKKIVFCCLNKLDLLSFPFFSEQTTGTWRNVWLSVGFEMRTEPWILTAEKMGNL